MTEAGKRNFTQWFIVTVIVTIIVFISVKPSFDDISQTFMPVSIGKSLTATFIATVVFSWLAVQSYTEDTIDVVMKTTFFFIKSPLEEFLFRFNSVLIARALGLDFFGIIIIAFIQAFLFLISHKRWSLKSFGFGFLWFFVAMFWGMIPVAVSHTTENLALRFKIRKEHGWYD